METLPSWVCVFVLICGNAAHKMLGCSISEAFNLDLLLFRLRINFGRTQYVPTDIYS